MAIQVEQGGEYRGETYITCTACPGGRYSDGPGIFEGGSAAELMAFLAEHGEH